MGFSYLGHSGLVGSGQRMALTEWQYFKVTEHRTDSSVLARLGRPMGQFIYLGKKKKRPKKKKKEKKKKKKKRPPPR
jgi:hypothetical protein